jgi:TetR/AcrR family transcriptional regulator, biofilm operon repressor
MARPVTIDEKRKTLLTKAVACFTRYGYSKTTLDDVARETGMNKATLYHYFKNKEALFLQVLLQVSSEGIGDLAARTAKVKQPAKQVVYYFTERLHYYLQIVRLNSLDEETLLHLQVLFDVVYQPVKENEVAFIAGILANMQPGKTKAACLQDARLLFDAADAIKHSAVFGGHLLSGDAAMQETIKKQISRIVTTLLKGIQA